ncbi:MAG: helix-turn-helix transcriptional regulator [Bacteriovoracaceae bacterium]|nr:helix-turn-helix transcriptional regulator [Bacteriovoracaceae bacterium]
MEIKYGNTKQKVRGIGFTVGESAFSYQRKGNSDNDFMDEIKIGKILRKLMKDKGLTYKKLSQLSEVSESTLKDWASGTEPRSFKSVRRVSRVLGVSSEFLIFGDADGPPSFEEVITKKIYSGWCKVSIEIPETSPIKKP